MKIIINKFGPIENTQIEFAPMLIYTGKSNLGKSYANYLTYYVMDSLSSTGLIPFLKNKVSEDKGGFVISLYDVQAWLNENVEVFFRNFLNAPDLVCNVKFELSRLEENPQYDIKFSRQSITNVEGDLPEGFKLEKVIQVSINEVTNYYIDIDAPDFLLYGICSSLSRFLLITTFGDNIDYSIILPPARGAFVGENYTLQEKVSSSVGMYKMFLRDYNYITQLPFLKAEKNKYIQQIEELVGGRLFSEKNVQKLELRNGEILPLSAAASSIKELSPFLFMLLSSYRIKKSICWEEPEAHLHPSMQIAVADLIASCFNDGMFFQYTTHSDYIMQRINQLIKLEFIKEKSPIKFDEICNSLGIDKRLCIDKDKIKVYFFQQNDNGKVNVELLPIESDGFPLVSFFEVVSQLSEVEDTLNHAIDLIKAAEEDGREE